MSSHNFDALIVGAGVAGSTAAILLAQAGWSVALVEKRAFPRRKVCGECISASNLPLLDALGVGETFAQRAGAALRRVGLFAGEHKFSAALPRYPHPQHGWGRALGREHLDTLLRDRAVALGASVWQPWSVRDAVREGGRHVCSLLAANSAETAEITAAVLIDAHGSWEADPFGKQRHLSHASDLFAFKGNFSGADLEAGLLPVLAFAGGYGGMVVADDELLTLACCIRRDALQTIRARAPGAKAGVAVQAYLEASCLGVRHALANAQPHDSWLSVGPIRPGVRHPVRASGLFAIGNAAGEAHPILGEGISMAIQSAWLLSAQLIAHRAELVAGRGSVRASRAYASNWRRSFAPRIRTAAVLSHLAMRPSAAGMLLPVLRRWPGILTAAARVGGKVRCVVDPAALVVSP